MLLSQIQARLAAGEALKFAAYGDSTTDGSGTSGWTANPVDVAGFAVGISDHAPTAPNAWPAKLETILRSMYPGDIRVWNAGYGGRCIHDGWAHKNYERAVISNSQYGIPDVCFVAFGLNDMNPAGSQMEQHKSETKKLIEKIRGYGTIPILLTCDPIWRNDPTQRDHKEAERQINAAKKEIAAELGIPIIDVSEAMKLWLSRNLDGYAWGTEQPDGLHFGDKGHAFKACLIAKELFRDIVKLSPGEWRRVETFDSATSFSADWSEDILTSSFSEQGGNISINSNAPVGAQMMGLWVWNENPEAELIYRGIDEERYLGADFTNAPYIKHYNALTGVSVNKNPAGVGFEIAVNSYHRTDLPYRFGHLPYGLSFIRYYSGDASVLRHGFFEFWSTPKGLRRHNALKNAGYYSVNFPTSPTIQVQFLAEQRDGSNVFGLMGEEKVDIFADISLPIGTGFIFAHSRGWGTGLDNGSRNFSMLYRNTATEVRIYPGYVLADGVSITYGASIAVGTLTSTSADQKLRFRIYREMNVQKVEVYQQLDGGTPVLTASIARGSLPVHWAGAVGGFYRNRAAPDAGSDIAVVRMLSILRS